MHDIYGLRYSDIEGLITELGGKKFNTRQIWSWIYRKNCRNIEEMTDISSKFRKDMEKHLEFGNLKILKQQQSSDGTIKFLFELNDGNVIESVLIPEKTRNTLCVSSQSGCRFNCSFCSTGKMGFKRDLSSSEIVLQVMCVSSATDKRITNVVFMGMGEPFDNYNNVIKAADIINDDRGLALGKRKITISTFGHIDGIKKYIQDDVRYKLAVSLHSPFEIQRSKIMPGNRIYHLKDLFITLKNYTDISNRKVVFEYILMEDLNDSQKHAEELIRLLSDLPSKLNLIKYHTNPLQKEIRPADDKTSRKFLGYFKNAPFPVVFRASRGEDISAACGQLIAEAGNE